MKKSKIKFAVKKAVVKYYENAGFTNTADKLLKDINRQLDKLYYKK